MIVCVCVCVMEAIGSRGVSQRTNGSVHSEFALHLLQPYPPSDAEQFLLLCDPGSCLFLAFCTPRRTLAVCSWDRVLLCSWSQIQGDLLGSASQVWA